MEKATSKGSDHGCECLKYT